MEQEEEKQIARSTEPLGVQAGRAMALADEGAGDGGGGAAAAAGEEEEQLLHGVHAQGDGGGDQHVQ